MMLNYYEPQNFFFFGTRNNTKKYQEAKANPHFSFCFYDAKTRNQVIAQGIYEVLEDDATKQMVWTEQWRQYGYSGPQDPLMVILKLYIHTVVQHFLGQNPVVHQVAQCPLPAMAVSNYQIPADTAPVDTAQAMTLLRDCYAKDQMTNLSTHDGPKVTSRFMMMRYKDDLGFYYLTYANSAKLAQLSLNPVCNIEWYFPAEGMKQVNAQAIARIYQNAEQRNLVWGEDLRQFGFQGPTDPNLTVIRLDILRVDVMNFGSAPVSIRCDTPTYLKGLEVMAEAFAKTPNVFLASHAPEGRIAGRAMMMRFHPILGYLFLTHAGSNKVREITANPNIAVVWNFDKPAPQQVHVKGKAVVLEKSALRHTIWDDMYTQFGFQGPHDDGLIIIRYLPIEISTTTFGKPEEVVYRL